MFYKYLELLEKSIERLITLNIEDVSFVQYLSAVGYEFLLVLLGVAYIALIMGIFIGPYILSEKIKNKIDNKYTNKYKELFAFSALPSFKPYDSLCRKIHNSMSALEKFKIIDTELISTLSGFNDIYNLLKNAKQLKDKGEYKQLNNIFDKIIETINMNNYVEKQASSEIEYAKVHDKCENVKYFVVFCIYFVWLMFVIPLILIFI